MWEAYTGLIGSPLEDTGQHAYFCDHPVVPIEQLNNHLKKCFTSMDLGNVESCYFNFTCLRCWMDGWLPKGFILI